MPHKTVSKYSQKFQRHWLVLHVLVSFLYIAVGTNAAQATVISLNEDGTYSTNTKLDFLQQEKQDLENLILEIPLTRVSAATQTKPHELFAAFITSTGEKFDNISPDIIQAVIKTESNFNAKALSPKGAQGLMQLMPATVLRYGLTDVYDPQQNIEAGSAELSRLLTLYHDLPIALAAYNAGEVAVKKYDGIPPFSETQNYVVKVLSEILALQTKKISAMTAVNISTVSD
ncbi:Membrane-bound lytic murein transglycosylase D precursor [hydrothermal vent metagenome]|uniref:Membrane-bound lytic murein transglycosylase D n=1 Tax=hydrothermal vent metagenome TaxID=652676 RepID=A0A3B0T085_9ZZZZ